MSVTLTKSDSALVAEIVDMVQKVGGITPQAREMIRSIVIVMGREMRHAMEEQKMELAAEASGAIAEIKAEAQKAITSEDTKKVGEFLARLESL